MQKIILLLPLIFLIFCTAQESEVQSLIHTRTHNVDFVQRKSTNSPYLCPDNYVYLVRDFQIFNGVVCVMTAITDIELQQGDCSPGWATILYNEVFANIRDYCTMLGSGDVARIDFMGSLSGQSCSLLDYTTRRTTQTLCVKREIKDIKLVLLKDNICGEGMVLVTPQEAKANQDAYCSLLSGHDIVRLAGGGSIDGPAGLRGMGCKIRYEENGDLSAVLCRAIQNSEPNENEAMVIPETTTIFEATFNAEQPLNGESNVSLENTEQFCCW